MELYLQEKFLQLKLLGQKANAQEGLCQIINEWCQSALSAMYGSVSSHPHQLDGLAHFNFCLSNSLKNGIWSHFHTFWEDYPYCLLITFLSGYCSLFSQFLRVFYILEISTLYLDILQIFSSSLPTVLTICFFVMQKKFFMFM